MRHICDGEGDKISLAQLHHTTRHLVYDANDTGLWGPASGVLGGDFMVPTV